MVFHGPFSTDMNASTAIGQPGFTSTTAATTQSGLHTPIGASLDSSGNLWVADTNNNRLLEYLPPFSSGMNASLVIGQTDFTSATSGTTQSTFNAPFLPRIDGATGDLCIVDSANNRVLIFEPPFSTGMNASTVIGQTTFTSATPGTTQNTLDTPQSCRFDNLGDMWIADGNNSRVLEFSPPFTNGLNASVVIGQSNFTSATPGTTQNTLNVPTDATFDPEGNLYVDDTNNNRVLIFDPPFSNGMNASLVIGQSDFTTATANLTQAGLKFPLSIVIDLSGALQVADSSNNRVTIFDPPFSNGMNASVVLGQPDFTTGTAATSQNGFNDPQDVFAN